MSQIARKHHFVPQCYLAGFTDDGSKTGNLCVFDFQVHRFFRTKPKNVAFEMDFNRFETNNYPPDALESAFGQFEGKVASVIRDISRAETIPEDEAFMLALDRNLCNSQLQSARAGGFVTSREILFEHVRDLIRKGEYTIKHD